MITLKLTVPLRTEWIHTFRAERADPQKLPGPTGAEHVFFRDITAKAVLARTGVSLVETGSKSRECFTWVGGRDGPMIAASETRISKAGPFAPGCEDHHTDDWRQGQLLSPPHATLVNVLLKKHSRTRAINNIVGSVEQHVMEQGESYAYVIYALFFVPGRMSRRERSFVRSHMWFVCVALSNQNANFGAVIFSGAVYYMTICIKGPKLNICLE